MRMFKVVAIGLVMLLGYPVWLGYQVWERSRNDQPRPADAIVVLGAAQYNGRPSPVYRARLDHAAYLYNERLAPRVITTGGRITGDSFTEAGVGRDYLSDRGVPGEVILAEDEGRSSLESLRNVRAMADERGISSVLLVSDPLHSERIARIAADLGFEPVHVSWASYLQLNRSRSAKARALVREVGALLLYETLGR